MRTVISAILLIVATTLFEYNFEITNYFYPDTSTVELNDAWWNLRFKIKSVLRLIFVLVIMLNVNLRIRIIAFPVFCLVGGDVISRVFFNSPEWHWTDYILIVSTGLSTVMLIVWYYAKSRTRIFKGFY